MKPGSVNLEISPSIFQHINDRASSVKRSGHSRERFSPCATASSLTESLSVLSVDGPWPHRQASVANVTSVSLWDCWTLRLRSRPHQPVGREVFILTPAPSLGPRFPRVMLPVIRARGLGMAILLPSALVAPTAPESAVPSSLAAASTVFRFGARAPSV